MGAWKKKGVHNRFALYTSRLRECGKRKDVEEGKRIHVHLVEEGLGRDVFLGNHLISMYIKCGSIMDAHQAFNQMPAKNMVSWNTLIMGYARHGQGDQAFKLFLHMQHHGFSPDRVTFLSLFSACISPHTLPFGKIGHSCFAHDSAHMALELRNALLTMYSKCGSIDTAYRLFTHMPHRDLVSWNVIIQAFAHLGSCNQAFQHFQHLYLQGLTPDTVTFISIFNACATSEALSLGKLIHAFVVDEGILLDVIARTAMLAMYIKCGSFDNARRTFHEMPERDIVSWNVMLSACSRHGHSLEALKLFQQMRRERIEPDRITFINILSSCTSPRALPVGKLVHAYIFHTRVGSDIAVDNALVNMYAKCAGIQVASNLFQKMTERDVISWNAIITSYADKGFYKDAFNLFLEMQKENVKPNKVTFLSVLNACASQEALAIGKQMHEYIGDLIFEIDIVTELVKMYGRCGGIENAREIFEMFPRRDVVLWTSMIVAYGQHGYSNDALETFQQMQREGLQPDSITLGALLSACSYAGLLAEGLHCFCSISLDYNITPTVEHYNCIVDLLGRAGLLDEAEDFINNASCQLDIAIWMTLLGSCKIHGFIGQGRNAAEHAFVLDPQSSVPRVVLSNIIRQVKVG